jgi:hypothetical protein
VASPAPPAANSVECQWDGCHQYFDRERWDEHRAQRKHFEGLHGALQCRWADCMCTERRQNRCDGRPVGHAPHFMHKGGLGRHVKNVHLDIKG